MSRNDVAERLASLFQGRFLQGYVRWKVRSDPAYRATAAALAGRHEPLLDIGCGIGILPFYLREEGHAGPIIGIDFDERKIAVARHAAQRYRRIDFVRGDVRDPLPSGRDVVLLDVLHYLDDATQATVLRNVVDCVPPGGLVVIRQGLRDGSWRYAFQAFVDAAARVFRWMKAERLNYPTRQSIENAFAGFEVRVTPLWGRMPYNNYLFVFRRSV